MVTFSYEVKRIIKQRYAEGRTYLIPNDIATLAKAFNVSAVEAEALRVQTEAELLDAWTKAKTTKKESSISDSNAYVESSNSAIAALGKEVKKGAFSRANNEIQDKIAKAVTSGLRKNIDAAKLTNEINHAFDMGRARAATTVRTARLGKIRADKLIRDVGAGFTKFAYTGPETDREPCKEYLGKIFTIDEIMNHEDVQGLSFAIYCGGFNCRHGWLQKE